MHAEGKGADWLTAFRRYLPAMALGNLLWETLQLPLYTLWRTDPPAQLAFAVFHCTLGDVVIGTVALVLALALFGNRRWPEEGRRSVMLAALLLGAGYTVYSEYVNTALRQSWAYADAMPRLPILGTGLAPLAQWILLPPILLAFAGTKRAKR